MDLKSTLKGSLTEGFYPAGWDFDKLDKCCSFKPEEVFDRQPYWNKDFAPEKCETVQDFGVKLGHNIAYEIKRAKDAGRKVAFIFPVGPMYMYPWAVYFLKQWNVDCKHVYAFNMDEWSDADGNEMDKNDPRSFQYSMTKSFYEPLGDLTVPVEQRNFATRANLPEYADKIAALKKEGAELITIYGIGRAFHIAFWEPHFAADYKTVEDWKAATHRIGAKLHPLTVEQNGLSTFKSRVTQVTCFANTIGPGLFLQSDRAYGGGPTEPVSFWASIRYGTDPWVTSSFMPTMPGTMYFIKGMDGPVVPAVVDGGDWKW